jgi:capsular exopolysaccharide synthesis family protein
VTPVSLVAENYHKLIAISPASDVSNIVDISLEVSVKQKGIDILNSLISNYNQNVVLDKKAIADRTSDFINDRITNIASSLSSVDESAQEFKTGKGITDIASEANINLNIGASNRQELENASVQLDIASSMKDIVDNQDGYDVLPSNIGLSDASITNTTAKYNELVLERKRLLKSSNEKNPIIVNLDQQLSSLKRSMQTSLNSVTNNLALTVNNLSSQQSQINSRIYSVPKNERALRDITRRQQTTEALYLYLLQKREESQIAYASAKPKSKVVDAAYSSELPVSPNIPVLLFASFVLGLLIPFTTIYVHGLLDNKIHNKLGLERLIRDIPVLAELPKLSKKDNAFIIRDDRSVLAESLRILRTNLDYLIKTNKVHTKGNVIFITSSVPGEGKTFVSSNLSMILASTNKKVLLIGADIRNPKLYSFFTGKNIDKLGITGKKGDKGLTEYLYNGSLSSADIINSMLVHKNSIDVIYSGKIPPNPAELIMSERLKDLFAEMSEKYDYVIVDTAPILVVTDTLLISENADQIIYVTRAGMTDKKIVDYPIKLQKEGKLKRLSFVVNDVKDSNLGYGGGYGYGYGRSTKKWWKL